MHSQSSNLALHAPSSSPFIVATKKWNMKPRPSEVSPFLLQRPKFACSYISSPFSFRPISTVETLSRRTGNNGVLRCRVMSRVYGLDISPPLLHRFFYIIIIIILTTRRRRRGGDLLSWLIILWVPSLLASLSRLCRPMEARHSRPRRLDAERCEEGSFFDRLFFAL